MNYFVKVAIWLMAIMFVADWSFELITMNSTIANIVGFAEGDKNGNFMVDDNEITITELEGNGDFRSAECIEFLKQADVVVTNPPFSLFNFGTILSITLT